MGSAQSAKVIARIFGGLGNQLFCYAAARRLALVSGAELVLDHVSGFVRDDLYKRTYQLDSFSIPCRKASAGERLEPLSRIRRYAKRALNRRRPFEARSYIHQEGVDFDPRLLLVKPTEALYLEGYWQSEDYFADVAPTIRADLHIPPLTDPLNRDLAKRIASGPAVAVHVRFFDAPRTSGVNNTPAEYYSRAVAAMEAMAPGAHYFLFSDRPADARGLIPLPEPRVTCVSHNKGDANAYADLWLMSQCAHFIIANSTFSWWGAWLAAGAGKRVIAPSFRIVGDGKITSWGFAGLLPRDWIRL